MGLGNNSGKITYVNIKTGKLAIKKDNELHLFEYIEGLLVDIEIRDEEFNGDKYKKLCLKINDGREDFFVQMRLDSGYGNAFCSILPNVDLQKSFKLAPSYSEKDGKKRSGMFINQNGKAIKWYFTRDTPHDLPPLKEVTFKGKTAWDNTEQTEYFIDMLLNKIKPHLAHPLMAGPATQLDNISQLPEAGDITEPIDDLPF